MRTGKNTKIKIQTKTYGMVFKSSTTYYAHTLAITDQRKNIRVTVRYIIHIIYIYINVYTTL